MMAGKRAAEASPTVPPPHKGKKQRTTALPPKTPKPQKPEPSRGSAAFVVPATPGTIVELPARGKQLPTTKNNNAKAPEPSAQKTRPTQKQKTKQQPSSQQGGPPTTLPLEPHAAILGALQAKYAVRVLSVISSTRMEKRIKTILDHLGGAGSTGSTGSTGDSAGAALPGVVLLHARAPDANKLVSIAEIVKRRIREGHFAAAPAADQMTDDPPPPANTKNSSKKKKKRKSTQASAVAWYQYDRIYDVQTARKKKKATSGDATKDGDGNEAVNDDGDDDDEEEEDDGFEPMMHRLESALVGGAQGSATKVTTYMSILLSRVPLSELHKNPEISVQCSTDPLEVEYEEYMAGA